MEKLRTMTAVRASLLIGLVLLVGVLIPRATQAPEGQSPPGAGEVVVHRVNAGGPEVGSGVGAWGEDSVDRPSPFMQSSSNQVETAVSPVNGPGVPEGTPSELFETMRWFSGARSGHLRYQLPRGEGEFTVRAYFVERTHEKAGGRQFHVDLDGERVLTNYDIYADAGAARTGVVKEWTRSYDSAGDTVVELSFGAVDAPVISGIEILTEAEDVPEPTEPRVAGGSGPAERLGLHVSVEELAIWRDRWVNGVPDDPFLDARVRDEKRMILESKEAFESDPKGHLWTFEYFEKEAECIERDDIGSSGYFRAPAVRTQQTAFYALLHEDPQLMAAVRDQLVQQPDQPHLDFTESHWCGGSEDMRASFRPGLQISHAMVSALMTYDYVKIAAGQGWVDDFKPSEDEKLRDWFLAFAEYCIETPRDRLDENFPNWENEDYETLAAEAAELDDSTEFAYMYDGGPQVHITEDRWNNRGNAIVRFVGLTGIVFDKAEYRDFAAEWFRNTIRFAVYPHGATSDLHRGYDGDEPEEMSSGLGYMARQYTHGINFIDALARAGDTSLYDFKTTDGLYETEGSPSDHGNPEEHKSWEFYGLLITRYSDGTYDRVNEDGVRYDWEDSGLGRHEQLIAGNLYFQNEKMSDFYRGENGMHPWKDTDPGNHQNENDSGAYPAPYLMWAGLEGEVWPYPER